LAHGQSLKLIILRDKSGSLRTWQGAFISRYRATLPARWPEGVKLLLQLCIRTANPIISKTGG